MEEEEKDEELLLYELQTKSFIWEFQQNLKCGDAIYIDTAYGEFSVLLSIAVIL